VEIDKNKFLTALGVGIAGVAIGVSLFEGFKELFEETDLKIPPKSKTDSSATSEDPVIKKNWIGVGHSLLKELPQEGDTDLHQHLRRQYLGLYLIGRCKERLKASVVDSLAVHLQHFHKMLNRDTDWPIMAWYETVGVSQSVPLAVRLQDCPEILELGVVPEFIGYALRESMEEDDARWGDALSDINQITAELNQKGILKD
jgi:hypothetical protein